MARKLLIASAGAGKSTLIAEEALIGAKGGGKVLLLTYTINNQQELVKHICRIKKVQPSNIVVKGWFSFLLDDMVRPYQRCIVPNRISGILLNEANPHLITRPNSRPFNIPGRRQEIDGKCNPLHYVTQEDSRAHTFYLAKLAATIQRKTGGMPARRLAQIYSAVFIDEMQDLVGWDFEVVRALAKSEVVHVNCVGDFRQAVYQTSETTKKPQTSADKIAAFEKMGFKVESLAISRRCIQSICDLADRLHAADGHYEPTKSLVTVVPPEYAAHQGVFAVSAGRVQAYISRYNPVLLRWNRKAEATLCTDRITYNFGDAKGLGFERVLILPPDKHSKFLSGNVAAFDGAKSDDSRNKLYVAITRARYSVAFLHKGNTVISGAQLWK